MNQPIITLKMVPAGAEVIVKALRAVTPLPDPNIDAFVAELWGQYQRQAKAAQEAAQAAPAATPPTADEKPASAPSEEAVGGTD